MLRDLPKASEWPSGVDSVRSPASEMTALSLILQGPSSSPTHTPLWATGSLQGPQNYILGQRDTRWKHIKLPFLDITNSQILATIYGYTLYIFILVEN